MSSKIELLQKIKALAEQGVGGEKETAQIILQELMKKYGVTDEDLEQDETELTWFRFRDNIEEKLLAQIIYMVTNKIPYGCKRERRVKKLGIECTVVEKMEIELNYEFYKKAMVEELKIFFSAFINKNGLYPPNTKKQNDDDNRDVDIEEVKKIMAMMGGMDQHILRKMIEGGEHR